VKPLLVSLALLYALAAPAAEASCDGARLVLLPFDAVALSRTEARELEDAVRRALARTPGVCLETRARTVERLRSLGGRLSPCADAGCRGTQVASLEADQVVRGRVLGVGGGRTVSLALVGRDGSEARHTFPVASGQAEEPALRVFGELWAPLRPAPASAASRLGPWPKVMMGVGAAALAAGVGFGLAARSTERSLSTGTGGCSGEGEAFRRCFADRLGRGEQQTTVSNVLLGTGALLGAGGAVLFIWELP
jgi:hypothetical protein